MSPLTFDIFSCVSWLGLNYLASQKFFHHSLTHQKNHSILSLYFFKFKNYNKPLHCRFNWKSLSPCRDYFLTIKWKQQQPDLLSFRKGNWIQYFNLKKRYIDWKLIKKSLIVLASSDLLSKSTSRTFTRKVFFHFY